MPGRVASCGFRCKLCTLLVDHINAGLWLPPGGHVEPDEHPADTARRETREELGIDPVFAEEPAQPSFITVTRTVGRDHRHVDVSLWFLLIGTAGHAPDGGSDGVQRGPVVDARSTVAGRSRQDNP